MFLQVSFVTITEINHDRRVVKQLCFQGIADRNT